MERLKKWLTTQRKYRRHGETLFGVRSAHRFHGAGRLKTETGRWVMLNWQTSLSATWKEMNYTCRVPVMEHPFFGSLGIPDYRLFRTNKPVWNSWKSSCSWSIPSSEQHWRYSRLGTFIIRRWTRIYKFDGTYLYEHADPRKGFHPIEELSSTTEETKCDHSDQQRVVLARSISSMDCA